MNKNKLKSILCGAIFLGLSCVTSINTFASESGTDITIEVKPTNIDVTVPSSIPFVFNENGTTTLPSEWIVTNNSSVSDIYISAVKVDGTNSGWKVVNNSYDFKSMYANTKNVRLHFGELGDLKLIGPADGSSESFVGRYEFGDDSILIPASSYVELEFDLDRGAFTEAHSKAKAFEMTLEFSFL